MRAALSRLHGLNNDFFAGVVVFLVALPLCLGIAIASNAPIVSGLLAGIVGGLVVGFLSGSHTSVSGPAAGLTAVIAAQITQLGSFDAFLAALVIAGLIQIAFGLARAGFISAFFPTSVIKGLLAAIGFILILKQLPHLVGFDIDPEGEMAFLQRDQHTTFSELSEMINHVHWGAFVVGIASLVVLVLLNRSEWFKKTKMPSPLLVVVFGTALGFLFSYLGASWSIGSEHRVLVPVVNSFSDIASLFQTPKFSVLANPSTWIAGLSLALVASLETLLNLEAIDKIDQKQRKSPANRELVAQGVGNLLLGLIGGLPTTSVIVRSSVNINAGAQTKRSAIIHGLLLLICVLLLPAVINQIPLSCLAAILIITGLKLVRPAIFVDMWAQGKQQLLPFLSTFLGIVFTDLIIGVMIGLCVSVFFILQRNIKGPVRVMAEHHMNGEIIRVILDSQVSFLNRASLRKALDSLPQGSRVVIDAKDTDYIDADVLDMLNDFRNEAASVRKISISTVGFKEHYEFADDMRFIDHATSDLQRNVTPEQVKNVLKMGNARVIAGERVRRDLNRQIAETATGQYPFAAILSCIDSRVPAELVFDMGIGDVFNIRMAGNVISEKVLGSLEFACSIAGAKLIVVMGHTRCGAVSAAYRSFLTGKAGYDANECENLGTIVHDIHHVIAISRIYDVLPNQSTEQCENFIVRENVRQSIRGIKARSKVIGRLLAEEKIGIVGCIYDVSTGVVEFLDNEEANTSIIPPQKMQDSPPAV